MHGGNSATVASAVQPGFRKDRVIFIFLKIKIRRVRRDFQDCVNNFERLNYNKKNRNY